MSYKFKVSTIMPIYKAEKYLIEAVNSVFKQTIGFKKNVQLILVNDGSPDNSGVLCDKIKLKYPDNIIVIHKENGGASSAREEGLKHAEGEYIHFFDSDDTIDKNMYKQMYKFFKKNNDSIDIVSCPIKFFGDRTGQHPLNYKYSKGTRVVNLLEEPNNPQMSLVSSLIKSKSLQGIPFDKELVHAEDAKMIAEILLNNPKLGLVSNIYYNYRKHGTESILGQSSTNPRSYNQYLELFSKFIINQSIKQTGIVQEFIKYTVMYDLQWKIKTNLPEILSDNEKKQFKKQVIEILQYIDDKIIYEQKHLSFSAKIHFLAQKHNKKAKYVQTESRYVSYFTYDNELKINKSNFTTNVYFFDIQDNNLHIELSFDVYDKFMNKKPEIYIELDKERFTSMSTIERPKKQHYLDDSAYTTYMYTYDIPISKDTAHHKVNIVASYDDENYFTIQNTNFAQFCSLSKTYFRAFFTTKDYIIKRGSSGSILINKYNKLSHLKSEIRFLFSILKNKQKYYFKSFALRLYHDLTKWLHRKPIWLISDRINKAGDNGESFFRFLKNKKDKSIKPVFTINQCEDYKELKKVGKVVKKTGFSGYITHLRAKYIISAHADENVTNPFGSAQEAFKDILNSKKFIFLQHGVINSDMSGWLNKYNKNIIAFVTSAEREKQSIIESDYYYSEEKIWLTGLPRFDRLENKREKIITIMPTWRKYLLTLNPTTKLWDPLPKFSSSEYFNFYNNLINDKSLITIAKEYGYKIKFMPHPTIMPSIHLFNKNQDIEFMDINTKYKDIYSKSALVISDYSSAVFDMAYLRKPIIYAQFDKDEFYSGKHLMSLSFFDHEKDGFGEVTKTYKETVKTIIDYIKNDCELKEKYRKRIDNFFAFSDRNCCERVYKKIKDLEKK